MPESPSASFAARGTAPWQKDAAALLLLVVAAVLLRLTSFVPAVVDTDEGLYMVQAREWLNGGWPLVAAWDMHPIGAPAMVALAFLAFGVSVEAVRLLGLICVAVTACALYAAARGVGAPRAIGLGAGLLYAAQSVLLTGICTNTEILMAPFVATAMAIAMRGAARALGPERAAPGFGAIVAMGLPIGCALLIKQVAAPEGCLAFALLVGPALLRGLLPWRRLAGMAALYAALCAGPFALAGFAYWTQGWLDQYLDGSLLAPFRYAMERIEPAEAMRRITAAALLVGFGLGFALVALVAWRPREALQPVPLLTAFAALWFVVASLAISAPGFYFAHYFLLWLPSLSILAATGAFRLAVAFARPGLTPAAFAGLIGIIAADAWLFEMQYRFDRGPGLVNRDPVRKVAAQVARAAGPGGDALIANYHASVYVIAGVRTATRFPFPPHLTGVFEDLSDTSTEAELDRVLAARPRVIVVDRGWMQTMRPAAAAQVMAAVAEGYELFASVPETRGPVEIYRAR
ncbi:ArnT family glycosyltransferase [Falsiroseomonas sp.]|uniref:ArnT family glycosyltransferase n=1 Tax=Falsiroseomonas sp. TaxID=2870721 RepID=UPI0035673694